MAQGGIGYAANGLVDGFLQGYQVFHKAKEDKEYKKLKAQLIQSQITRNNRGPVARPVRDYTAINRRANSQADLYDARRKLLLNPPAAPPGDQEGVENSIAPAAGPRSAIPPAPGGEQVSELQPPAEQGPPEASPEAVEQAPTVQSAAKGGMISAIPKRYADGGDVEDDDEEEDPEEEEDDGATANSESTQGSPQDYSIMAAHDAARDGIVHSIAQNNVGGHGLAVPAQPAVQAQNNRAHLTGAGAASHLDMERIRNKVDPDHKLEEGERNMAALSAVQSYYLKQNNPKAAQETAASMVGYFRKEFDRNKAMAGAAAEHGDIDTAIDYSKKAYANLPDGMKYDAKKNEDGSYTYNLLDGRTGKPLFKPQTVTPEVMLKQIQDSANSSFDGLMAAASGHRAGLTKPPPEPKAVPLATRTKASENVDAELGKVSDETWKTLPQGYKETLASAASHIHASNDMDPRESIQAVKELTGVNGTKLPKPAADGSVTATLKEGGKIKLSSSAVAQIALLRSQTQDMKNKLDAKAADEEKLRAAQTKASGIRTEREAEFRSGLRDRMRAAQSYSGLGTEEERRRLQGIPPRQ